MKALLICLFVLLALFTSTEAARLKNTASNRAAAKTNTKQNYNCFYYWDCYWTDIPGIGEEEICDYVQQCYN